MYASYNAANKNTIIIALNHQNDIGKDNPTSVSSAFKISGAVAACSEI
jgi:hypothetical protein